MTSARGTDFRDSTWMVETNWEPRIPTRTRGFIVFSPSGSRGLQPEMKALPARQVVKAVARQGRALAAVADAGPRQRWVEVVAAILIDCARVHVAREPLRALAVARPDGRGEPVARVLHVPEGL